MGWYKIKLSDKELSDLKSREKQETKVQLLKRLQCIKLKNNNWKNKDLSNFFWVCIDTITNRIKLYKENGIEWLLSWECKGKISQLTEKQKEQLKTRNDEVPFKTAKEAMNYIENQFWFKYHLHSVQKMLKKTLTFIQKNGISTLKLSRRKNTNRFYKKYI